MIENVTRPDLTAAIPRGLTTKFLKDQSLPQAKWQPQELVEAHEGLRYDPLQPNGKVLLGAIGEKLIGYADDRHIMTRAGTRAGKSVTVTANLFFYDGSVIVIDPKGELARKTAIHRAAMGQKVYALDPFDILDGEAAQYRACYNELASLDANSETIIEDAMQVVESQIVKNPQEKDPHWNESAADSMLGFVLYVKFGSDLAESERNLITVRKLIKQARRMETVDKDTQRYIVPNRIMRGIKHLRGGPDDDIAEVIEASITGLYEKSSEEMASVLSTLNRHTAYLDFRAMRKVKQGHDFNLRDLKRSENGTTIYICLPATRLGSCKRWLRGIINQLIAAMEAEKSTPKVPVLGIIDEFPVLGHMSALEDAAGQIASFGLRLWLVIQDEGQGEAIYGQRWQSFSANCGVVQSFANADLKTCEYISKQLGQTPVLSLRGGDTSADQRDKGLSGQSTSMQLYPLLSHDEVARTFARSDPLKRQLLQIAGLGPIILQRVEHWNEEAPYYHYFSGK